MTIAAIDKAYRATLAILQYGEKGDLLASLRTLVGECMATDVDTEDWCCIGECEAYSVDSLIVGAYWALSEWHGGQASDSYATLCALGGIFHPGMTDGPEEGTAEELAYEDVGAWCESRED